MDHEQMFASTLSLAVFKGLKEIYPFITVYVNIHVTGVNNI